MLSKLLNELDTLNNGGLYRTDIIYDPVSTWHIRCAQIEHSYRIAFPRISSTNFSFSLAMTATPPPLRPRLGL